MAITWIVLFPLFIVFSLVIKSTIWNKKEKQEKFEEGKGQVKLFRSTKLSSLMILSYLMSVKYHTNVHILKYETSVKSIFDKLCETISDKFQWFKKKADIEYDILLFSFIIHSSLQVGVACLLVHITVLPLLYPWPLI